MPLRKGAALEQDQLLEALEEIVVEREPPRRKAWETIESRLLVIGQYRLGFELEPRGDRCLLRVSIDYDRPHGVFARLAAALCAKSYARWCTGRIARDAGRHFGSTGPDPSVS